MVGARLLRAKPYWASPTKLVYHYIRTLIECWPLLLPPARRCAIMRSTRSITFTTPCGSWYQTHTIRFTVSIRSVMVDPLTFVHLWITYM